MAIRKDFGFIGRLSLDFAQTGDMGFGSRFERLINTAELARWFSLSPLRLTNARVWAADLECSRKLRGAIWRVASAILAGRSPDSRDVRRLNGAARQPGLVKQLNRVANSSHWHRPTAAQALATIAQDAVALFGDPQQRAKMHRCENPKCHAIFYDDSRPGLRRWCASNRCGDRIRAQTYRRRHRPRRVSAMAKRTAQN
jgi:predicted RNA-binding Zn ribbon-like protein